MANGWPAARDKLRNVFKSQPQQYWCALLENTDVCFGPVLSLQEAQNHRHNQARGTFINIADTMQGAPAPRFSGTPASTPMQPPIAGEHNEEVFSEWGFNQEEIASLKSSGAI